MLRWSAVQAKNVDGGVAVVPTAQPLPEQSTPSEAIRTSLVFGHSFCGPTICDSFTGLETNCTS
jgi:hypothetical protein